MGGIWVILLNVEFGGLFQKQTMFCECILYINMVSNANKVGLALITMPYLGRFAVSWEWRTISERKSVVHNSTRNMIFSVRLYLVLLSPYHVQHYILICWQLVLDINVPLPSLLPPSLLLYIFFISLLTLNSSMKLSHIIIVDTWCLSLLLMLLTFIGLLYAFVSSVSFTKYHIFCIGLVSFFILHYIKKNLCIAFGHL